MLGTISVQYEKRWKVDLKDYSGDDHAILNVVPILPVWFTVLGCAYKIRHLAGGFVGKNIKNLSIR